MPRRIIFDNAEPVVLREYANESLAALDKAVLAAADIPAMLVHAHYTEVAGNVVQLAVRQQDVKTALEVLGGQPSTNGPNE